MPELFAVERYPNVWQMTSLVRAQTRASLEDIFAALHPSASVTGAPKVRTMEIIERSNRSRAASTPAPIGLRAPRRQRPLQRGDPDGGRRSPKAAARVRRRQRHRVGFGPDAEYDECLLKGSVLGRRRSDFELLETMRWTPATASCTSIVISPRMRASAEYFGFAYDEAAVRAALCRRAVAARHGRAARRGS